MTRTVEDVLAEVVPDARILVESIDACRDVLVLVAAFVAHTGELPIMAPLVVPVGGGELGGVANVNYSHLARHAR